MPLRTHTCRLLWIVLGVAAFLRPVVLQAFEPVPVSQDEIVPRFEEFDEPGRFVVALAQDQAGQVWVGTEDKGVYRYNPLNGEWTQFTTKHGLGDNNAYALCCDPKGRIWAGLQQHGVAVFNGKTWRTYDVLDGPIGERVFDLACSPLDGDVWIASSAGLTRYSQAHDRWAHYTRADGLPADQVQSLAFGPEGNLYAATQCDGLAVATANQAYRDWRRLTKLVDDRTPVVSSGRGLPSNLINDVLVSRRDGTLYVATACGLATSKDGGKKFTFVRGADWAAKVKGRYGGPPQGWQEKRAKFLLLEDYCTCLGEDESGNLWIGHRQEGLEIINPVKQQRQPMSLKDSRTRPDYVFAMLPTPQLPQDKPLIACYGPGLFQIAALWDITEAATRPENAPPRQHPNVPGSNETASFPSPNPPPTLEELNELLEQLGEVPSQDHPLATAVPLADDWRTQGDWIGRYGRYWACLAAIDSPRDYLWGGGPEPVKYDAQIGPHGRPDDSLRYWVHWLYTDNHCTLELPPIYMHSRVMKGLTTWDQNRRQAEWGDSSESYPFAHEGPDLYCSLAIPEGQFYLSLYDFNKDGHASRKRVRDYSISIRPHDAAKSLDEIEDFDKQPEWARGRIHHFWGGVWKRYYVEGPTQLTFQVRRNNSFCTILAGVMLDLVDERPLPYFHSLDEWRGELKNLAADRASLDETATAREARFAPRPTPAAAAEQLFHQLQLVRVWNRRWWLTQSRPYYATLARWYRQLDVPLGGDRLHGPLASCYYQLRLFPEWENEQRAAHLLPARDIEKALRWDGKTSSMQGKGYQAVREYLQRRHQQPATETVEVNPPAPPAAHYVPPLKNQPPPAAKVPSSRIP